MARVTARWIADESTAFRAEGPASLPTPGRHAGPGRRIRPVPVTQYSPVPSSGLPPDLRGTSLRFPNPTGRLSRRPARTALEPTGPMLIDLATRAVRLAAVLVPLLAIALTPFGGQRW